MGRYSTTSLRALSTSPLVSRTTLMYYRFVALVIHLYGIVTGIITRKLIFFIQLTNVTNMLSFFYFLFAFSLSVKYDHILRVEHSKTTTNDRKIMLEYNRKNPSKLAATVFGLLTIAVTFHIIVTSVFWTLISWEFEVKITPWLDWSYCFVAHGITLILVFGEVLLTNVTFPRKNYLYVEIFMLAYGAFAIGVFAKTGYLVYDIIDYTKPFNRQVVYPVLFIVPVFMYEIGAFFAYIRCVIVESSNQAFKHKQASFYKAMAAAAAGAASTMFASREIAKFAVSKNKTNLVMPIGVMLSATTTAISYGVKRAAAKSPIYKRKKTSAEKKAANNGEKRTLNLSNIYEKEIDNYDDYMKGKSADDTNAANINDCMADNEYSISGFSDYHFSDTSESAGSN